MRDFFPRFIALILIPAAIVLGIDWSTADLYDPEQFAPGQIVVRFADGVDLNEPRAVLNVISAEEIGRIEQLNALRLKLPEGSNILEAISYYESRPDVLYAEPVVIQRILWTPNDPLYSYQWHLHNINMPAAWDKERGSSSVIVAIIDSGVAYEDYSIPSSESWEVTSGDGYYHKATDLNSSQFVPGYDFVHKDSLGNYFDTHANDQHGHGTHVAGTVAQATDNGIGVAGMAPNCKLMPVQVLNYEGEGYTTDIAEGIIWAADNGADVINLSLGGGPSGIEHDAIIYANNRGSVVVAAAGNDGAGQILYPAAYDECIAVAALDADSSLAYYSNYGSGLDISAPGGDVYADENHDGQWDGVLQCTYRYTGKVDEFGYMLYQGTSMAAPHVAGLAALLISHGITGVENVKQAIYSTATDLGSPGKDNVYGWGMINPADALDYTGSGDVVMEVPILQNPLLSQYIDIWVVPTSGILTSAPDVAVTLNGDSETVPMEGVSYGYVGNYRFSSTGEAKIDVTSGNSSRSRTFNVEKIGVRGGTASSLDGRVYLEIPEDALCFSEFFTLIAEQTREGSSSNPHAIPVVKDCNSLGPAYRIGPAGARLASPASIRVRYTTKELVGTDLSTLTLMRYEDDRWIKVASFINREESEIVASVSSLGIFQLVSDPTQTSPDLPKAVELKLASSNPAGNQTLLHLALAEETRLSLEVFDASGRMVRTLAQGSFPAGEYEFCWDATDDGEQKLPPGIYFCLLRTPQDKQTLKLINLH